MSRRFGHALETSPPIAKPCGRCGRLMLTGLAEGQHAYVDVTPLTAAGEAAALRAGRHTYTLRRTGLIYRDQSRRNDPALANPVLADHDCPARRTR